MPTTSALPRVPARHRLLAGLLSLATAVGVVVADGGSAPAEARTGTAVMRPTQVSADQMASWFRASNARVSGYRATVSVETLTRYYVEEGRDEGVAGDLAFAQAVLETGSFSWPGYGQVRAAQNNFAGIGACDGGTCTVASFRNARIGVRAQIQHLRAYADPSVTVASLAHPVESPRFHLVSPKGKAPTWEQMGSGNWATDPAYRTKVLGLYASMRQHAGLSGSSVARISAAYVAPFRDVPTSHTHASAIAALVERRVTSGCTPSAYCPAERVTRAQAATLLSRAAELPAGRRGAFPDVRDVHQTGVDALAAAGITEGCAPRRYCPTEAVTRGQLASLLQRTLGLPDRPARFRDVSRGDTHAGAIGALAERGVIRGGSDGRFRASEPVSRAQIASFLHRAFPR